MVQREHLEYVMREFLLCGGQKCKNKLWPRWSPIRCASQLWLRQDACCCCSTSIFRIDCYASWQWQQLFHKRIIKAVNTFPSLGILDGMSFQGHFDSNLGIQSNIVPLLFVQLSSFKFQIFNMKINGLESKAKMLFIQYIQKGILSGTYPGHRILNDGIR